MNRDTVPPELRHGSDGLALLPFTVDLVRPARPDGHAAVVHHHLFDASPGDQDVVLATLLPGEPYEVMLDGRPVLRHEGNGWQHGQDRSLVTIRASASQAMLARLCAFACADDPARDGFLAVFLSSERPVEISLDGDLATPRR